SATLGAVPPRCEIGSISSIEQTMMTSRNRVIEIRAGEVPKRRGARARDPGAAPPGRPRGR
ncbi:hypothetical protein NBM05_11310, partial [Rothia sp. AR01]